MLCQVHKSNVFRFIELDTSYWYWITAQIPILTTWPFELLLVILFVHPYIFFCMMLSFCGNVAEYFLYLEQVVRIRPLLLHCNFPCHNRDRFLAAAINYSGLSMLS